VRIFGIDPGSIRTGYGCVETDGSRHRLVTCGVLAAPGRSTFPQRLQFIHAGLTRLLRASSPECVAIENLFHARNARSALVLGHARGVAVLAAVEAGLPVVEYSPSEIKLAVSGYGRAEKPQLQHMVKLLLGLDAVPSPHDAADALAIAICHAHSQGPLASAARRSPRRSRSWRDVRLPDRATRRETS
jgi:crossover junction endodeoxyribonuclease RuvC